MTCNELIQRLESRMPESSPIDLARICTLMCGQVTNIAEFGDQQFFEKTLTDVNLRLEAISDQHAAMTAELEELSNSDPRQFDPNQIWSLVRAIKVQSQVLRMYLGNNYTELV